MIVDDPIDELLDRWESSSGQMSAEQLCVDCAEYLPRLRQMIDQLRRADRLLEPVSDAPLPTIPGYTIEAHLGAGGMGDVFRATQLGTHRTVALKLIAAPRAMSARARARFEREVELASRLEHPHIARVYDSGVHEGCFYYAMELINGVPLDAFVAQSGMSRRQVLELLKTICLAVQHAHQLGIIHRDLKPSNILVSGDGQPHLLDFGLAKEILGDSLQITHDDASPGTPQYMSPEQAAGESRKVGVASDVYSLGVILYRILLHEFPHDVTGSSIQVMKRIATEDAKPPRSIDPTLHRDIEAVLLKALARNVNERYSTPRQFADDLGYLLGDRPIVARRRTRLYVVSKFLYRNRWKAGAAATVFAMFLAGAIWSYTSIKRQSDRAENEAEISAAANEFLGRMLTASDPDMAQGHTPSLPELLERASVEIDSPSSARPAVRGAIHGMIGRTYLNINRLVEAEKHLRTAIEIHRAQFGDANPATIAAVNDLADLYIGEWKLATARELLRGNLAAVRKIAGEHSRLSLDTRWRLARCMSLGDESEQAEPMLRALLIDESRASGPDSLQSLVVMNSLGGSLAKQGKVEAALNIYQEQLSRWQRTNPGHPRVAYCLANIAQTLAAMGRLNEAEQVMLRSVQMREKLFASDHPTNAYGYHHLAEIRQRMGNTASAEELYRKSFAINRATGGDDTLATLDDISGLLDLLASQGRLAEAQPLLDLANDVAERKLAQHDSFDAEWFARYGSTLLRIGRTSQARSLLLRAADFARQDLPRENPARQRLLAVIASATTQPSTNPSR